MLLMDEMYIREDVVYTKDTGELVGCTNLGDTNNHLLRFQHAVEGEKNIPEQTLAKTMMVIMVRGLFPSFVFPYVAILLSREINCTILCGRLYTDLS